MRGPIWRSSSRAGFAEFVWSYVDGVPMQNRFVAQADVPATELSARLSKDLKPAGFRFCGPTIVYAWMEATGLVNDHLVTCPRHEAVAAMG
jgi:DNA-3-methyladenine glycosylase I